MDSMFVDYFKEVEDVDYIGGDFGFFLYRIRDRECYIRHAYIKPVYRGCGLGQKLLSELEALVKPLGVKEITGNVFKKDRNWDKNKQIYTSKGFEIINENDSYITFCKDLL